MKKFIVLMLVLLSVGFAGNAMASWSNGLIVKKISWANAGYLKLHMSDSSVYYWIETDAEDYKAKLATSLTLVTSGIKVNVEHSLTAIRKLEIGE